MLAIRAWSAQYAGADLAASRRGTARSRFGALGVTVRRHHHPPARERQEREDGGCVALSLCGFLSLPREPRRARGNLSQRHIPAHFLPRRMLCHQNLQCCDSPRRSFNPLRSGRGESQFGASQLRRWHFVRLPFASDVTLGYDTVDEYDTGSSYFGSVVGRVANRIAKGTFTCATPALFFPG